MGCTSSSAHRHWFRILCMCMSAMQTISVESLRGALEVYDAIASSDSFMPLRIADLKFPRNKLSVNWFDLMGSKLFYDRTMSGCKRRKQPLRRNCRACEGWWPVLGHSYRLDSKLAHRITSKITCTSVELSSPYIGLRWQMHDTLLRIFSNIAICSSSATFEKLIESMLIR